MADISKITDVNGNSYDIKDETARQGSIYYATCSTAKGTQKKRVTIEAITELYTGLKLRILFTNAQDYNGTPTLQINNLTATNIRIASGTNAGRYTWVAGEVLDLVYDGTYFIIANEGRATTTYYGSTKLSSSSTSTSETLAATPKAIDNLARYVATGLAAFSTTETYAVGDRVRYGSYMYECITAVSTAGSWNAASWTVLDPLLTQIDDVKVSIPVAGSSTPLAASDTGAPGTSNYYAREDHKHPIRVVTYDAETGSFLDWVLTTFTNTNDEAYIAINTTNYTGLPNYDYARYSCFVIIQKIGACITLITQFDNGSGYYRNAYSGASWSGWQRIWINIPVHTYSQQTGNFLDYVISDIVPGFKANHENANTVIGYIPFETSNTSGWPNQSSRGYADVWIRGGTTYLTVHCRDGSCYDNYHDGTSWAGWTELAKASNIPTAGTSTPLEESMSGSVGTSSSFARQDHSHPVKTYLYYQQQEDFLPWVVSTFTTNGEYYVVLAHSNTTGLPENPCNSVANVCVRNSNIIIELITNTRNVYVTCYGGTWGSWVKLANTSDIPVAESSALPLENTMDGTIGSSNNYARSDHTHPGRYYRYWNIVPDKAFLPWVLETFTTDGFYYVLLAQGNYTGLPEQSEGIALVEYRSGFRFVELTCNATGNVYRNEYSGSWTGWKRFLFESDFTSSSSYLKMPDGTLIQWGKVGSLSFSNEIMIDGEITFGQAFYDTNYVITGSSTSTGNNAYLFRLGLNANTASKADWTLGSGSGAAISIANRGFSWTAIGRWKA